MEAKIGIIWDDLYFKKEEDLPVWTCLTLDEKGSMPERLVKSALDVAPYRPWNWSRFSLS